MCLCLSVATEKYDIDRIFKNKIRSKTGMFNTMAR